MSLSAMRWALATSSGGFPEKRMRSEGILRLLAVLHCWCCPLGRGVRLLEPRARCVPVTSISGGTTEGLSSEGLVDSQSSASKH